MKKIYVLILLMVLTGCVNKKDNLIKIECSKTIDNEKISYNINYESNNSKITKIIKKYEFTYNDSEESLNNSDNICEDIQEYEYKINEKFDECNVDINNNKLYVERINKSNIEKDYNYYKKYFKDNKYICDQR